ncbi:MAG: hypothetical protein AAFR96_05990 [Planctomycetota bacterium]
MRRCHWVGWVVLGWLAIVAPGCDDAAVKIDRIAAAAPAAGRLATADELHKGFLASEFTFQRCLEAAELKLSTGDPDAPLFAGAVLDLAVRIEDRFPTRPEFFMFWMRLGQLAYNAAFQAINNGRPDEAATLVLAGPARWQNDSYWTLYANHDILVALILAQQGSPRDGIARLRDRILQTPEMEAAIEEMEAMQRAQLRERLRQQIEKEQAEDTGLIPIGPAGG